MGLPDDFILPTAYQSAFKVIGDGLAVPSVRFLAERILEPLAMIAQNNTHRTGIHANELDVACYARLLGKETD